MRAGDLRHSIALERLDTAGVDAAGDPARVWVPVNSVWAKIEPMSLARMSGARDAIAAGANTAVDIVSVTMYPYPGIEALTWRFSYEGRLYDIKAVRPSNDGATLGVLATVGGSD